MAKKFNELTDLNDRYFDKIQKLKNLLQSSTTWLARHQGSLEARIEMIKESLDNDEMRALYIDDYRQQIKEVSALRANILDALFDKEKNEA